MKDIEDKISDITKSEGNAKMKDIEDKIPDITNLVTKTLLNIKQMKLKLKYRILVV